MLLVSICLAVLSVKATFFAARHCPFLDFSLSSSSSLQQCLVIDRFADLDLSRRSIEEGTRRCFAIAF